MLTPSVVLASRSEGKLRELRSLCTSAGVIAEDLASLGVVPALAEDDLEAYDTFEENAVAKGRYFASLLGGRIVIAEDSGLEVAALGGAPGVRSKRWAGLSERLAGAALDDANSAALARTLEGVADRSARYVCVAACVREGVALTARGECTGRMLAAPRGADGFGYDPWFESDELGKTFAEATREEKSSVSHRGRAVRALLAAMFPHRR